MYDPPGDETLKVGNFDDMSPEVAAQRILRGFDELEVAKLDFGRQTHLGDFHARAVAPRDPSPVAREVASCLQGPKGKFLVECRSVNDPMSRFGEVIGPTERIHGHYRRFIDINEPVERLSNARFQVESSVESNRLAVHKDEAPVVIRVTACNTEAEGFESEIRTGRTDASGIK